MKPLARAGRNLALKTLGEVLGRLCFLGLFIIAARVLGAVEYGRFSYASSIAALALVGMDLGLNTLFIRDGARDRDRVGAYAGTLFAVKLTLAFLVLAGIYFYCLLSGADTADMALILAVALAQTLWGLMELGVAGLNSMERMDLEAVVRALGRLAALVLCGCLLMLGLKLWGFVGGLLAANALAAGLGLKFLFSNAAPSFNFSRAFLSYLLREALPLALTNIFVLVYFRVDVVMLHLMGSSYEQIGWYAAGVRLVDGVGTVATLVSVSLLPVLSSLAGRDEQALVKLYRQGLRLLIILGIPAALGLWAVRGPAVVLIFGADFAPTARAMFWQAPCLVFLFMSFMQLATLTALGLQRRAAMVTGVCALANLGLNLVLIPSFGFPGAAAATLATNICVFGLCTVCISGRLGPSGILTLAAKPILAAGLMALFLWLARELPVLVIIPLGAVIYAAALVGLKGVTPSEMAELWGMVRHPGRPGAG